MELVIAGLTNTYSSYVTTFEEYGVQRYEGASTIYGPHTLDAYIQVCLYRLACSVLPTLTGSPSGLGWAGGRPKQLPGIYDPQRDAVLMQLHRQPF